MTAGARRCKAWLMGVALGVASMAVCAQTPPAASNEDPRGVLLADQAIQARDLDVQQQACYAQFFTTNCLLDVARQRRTMEADFKRKTAALDAADRQQRANEARQRVEDKQREQSQRQQALDPVAAEQAQQNKQADIDAKQQAHADKAAAALEPQPAKEPKAESGPGAAERAANRAAFDKKQALAKQRLADRDAQRAKAAASPASAPRALPLPPATVQ